MLKRGDPVTWIHRSGRGHGYIDSIASKGRNAATTRYRVHQVDHHTGEKRLVIHTGAALHRSTRAAVENAARKARKARR